MLLLVILCFAIMLFRLMARRRIVRGRGIDTIERLHAPVAITTEHHNFRDVMVALGSCYQIDPGLLRPEDSLQDLLQFDSWVLDKRTDEMNGWLMASGVEAEWESVRTVLDLALALERARLAC